MMQICLPVNGQQVCWPIPVLVDPWHIGPDPDPWVLGGIIDERISRQLQAMSTIAAAVEKLPAEHQRVMKAALADMTVEVEKRVPGASVKAFKPSAARR